MFEGFWAQRPDYLRILGDFDAQGEGLRVLGVWGFRVERFRRCRVKPLGV